MRPHLLLLSLAVITFAVPAGAQSADTLFAPIDPIETGRLRVSQLHEIYWERSGNPDGIPVFMLHGGPGVGINPFLRRMVDSRRYHIIAFDQRGCGQSTPAPEWRENTTQLLIDDINELRDHLGIDGPVALWGLSWGTTLALAYAETHPERVSGLILSGVFTCRQEEIDFLYHGGSAAFYPRNYERFRAVIPDPDAGNYPAQLFRVISGDDAELAKKAADATAFYELRMVALERTDEQTRAIMDRVDLTAFALLSTWYIGNQCFLEQDQLMREADRIAHIPTYISAGNQDPVTPPKTAYELSKRLDHVRLDIVPAASHNDMSVFLATAQGSVWLADQIAPE